MYRFQAFNHTVSSVLPFPELLTCSNPDRSAGIQIMYGDVSPNGLDTPLTCGPFFQTNQQHFWLNVPHIGRFLVSSGQRITVDPCKNSDEASLRVFILDSCFKALLSQQNCLVLEGCAIKAGSHGVLFAAPPGFGKSTLCALFFKHGYCVLADETCAIDRGLNLLPSYPAIHLWADIPKQLGIDSASLKPTRLAVDKYQLDVGNHLCSSALPIKLIYTVDYHKKDTLIFTELSSKEKLNILKNGPFVPPYVVPHVDHNILSQLVNDVQFINLTCPRWDYNMKQLGFLLPHVFDIIEKDIIKRLRYTYHGG